MLKTVIIEDEINSRELLKKMLLEYCSDVSLIGMAVDVPSGIELIKETKPDLIFLDIEMPEGNGFDVLIAFPDPSFKVVFVTGYDHYAIKAIKFAALDYLLKPVHLEELEFSINRAKNHLPYYSKNLQFLKNNLNTKTERIEHIMLPDSKSHRIILLDNILYLKAERTYVCFYLTNKQEHIVCHPLQYYQDLLSESSFFRIHKSYIINTRKIVKIEKGRGGFVHLTEDIKLPIALRRKSSFMKFLARLK